MRTGIASVACRTISLVIALLGEPMLAAERAAPNPFSMPSESADVWWWPWRESLPLVPERPASSSRPLRALKLVSGEHLYVECLRADRHAVEFRWRGRNRVRVPWEYVANLSNLPGVIDVLDESFETPSGVATPFAHSGHRAWRCDGRASPWRFECRDPIAAGQLQWCQRWDETAQGGATVARLQFGDGGASVTLALKWTPDSASLCSPPDWTTDFRQPLHTPRGWQTVAIHWGDAEWRVLIGGDVLATGRGAHGRLSSVEFGPAGEYGVIWIDDVRLQRREAKRQTPVVETDHVQTAVELVSGDVLFGDVISIDAAHLQLSGPRGPMEVLWTEWSALRRGIEVGKSCESRVVRGSVRHVQTAAPPWPHGLPAESWTAVLENRSGPSAEWNHPLLGPLVLTQDEVVRAAPGPAAFAWLLPGPVHLGDERRPGFSDVAPHGPMVSGTFSLDAVPGGRVFVTLDAVEMEPSGPDVPPGQPFLQQLRGGALRTELFVNGELVGDWNRLLSHRPPASHPERLRMLVPTKLLRIGTNQWELRQRPLAPNDHRFDDCELGRVALEVEP